MAGPTIQLELFAILLRFRTFKYVVNGDIAKMYRMIEIHPDHTDYQRIVWRENTEDPLKTYMYINHSNLRQSPTVQNRPVL
jgi:hypothetical protein